jgi:uncharacterized protein YcsI (UPF0317 family)
VSVSTITTFGCYGNVLQMLRVWDLTSFTCVVTVPYAATVVVGAPRVVLLDFCGFCTSNSMRCPVSGMYPWDGYIPHGKQRRKSVQVGLTYRSRSAARKT